MCYWEKGEGMSTFDYSKVKNPEYFQENRLPAHSDHGFYADELEEQFPL